MVQIEKNENGIAKAIDLFDGMNVHPIPMDFSNSMTTTEFLLNLQKKVNELIALWNESYKKLEELTEQQKTEILNTIELKLTEIKNDYKVLTDNIRESLTTKIEEEKTKRENEDLKLKENLEKQIHDIDTILNLISSDGQTISLTELFNNYYTINGKFNTLEKNVNNCISEFKTLKNEVNSFTENVAICKFIEQENMETPETLINDNIKSLSFTYSSTKIEMLLANITQTMNNITSALDSIGNGYANNRDDITKIKNYVTDNINMIEKNINSIENEISEIKYAFNNNVDLTEYYIQDLYNTITKINNKLYNNFYNIGFTTLMGNTTITGAFNKL